MNIIVPLGGSGRRFQEQGYQSPKPLINVMGSPMIAHVLAALRFTSDDQLFLVYNKELNNHDFAGRASGFLPEGVNTTMISLREPTRGAAETVLRATSHPCFALDQRIVVVDGDMVFREDILGAARNEPGRLNAVFTFYEPQAKGIYSYVKVGGEQEVMSIAEKQVISDRACAGAYVLESGWKAQEHINALLNGGEMENNEFYVSGVYRTILKNHGVVKNLPVSEFDCLGTPGQLVEYAHRNQEKAGKKRFCFDLDNTLFTLPVAKGDYSTGLPIQRNIDYLRQLYEAGHHIIIHTARRMRTHDGDVAAVVADIGQVTIDKLARHRVPYHELVFGKPYAQFYIDDLGASPHCDLAKETGFYSQVNLECRPHHSISFTGTTATKKLGGQSGEAFWYQNTPEAVLDLFPKLLAVDGDTLELEYVQGLPMSYLYTNMKFDCTDLFKVWLSLTRIHDSQKVDCPDLPVYANYRKKLVERYDGNRNVYDDQPGSAGLCAELLRGLSDYETGGWARPAVIHGDPVLSNILATSEGSLKFIDMRGALGGVNTIFGDVFYDWAKLHQSICGYDFILLGLELPLQYVANQKSLFRELFCTAYGEPAFQRLCLLTKSLLFSLLPLHGDAEKRRAYFNLIETVC